MRLRFFKIPLHGGTEEATLNHVLTTDRVLAVDRQLIADGAASAWAVCVSVLDGEAASPLRKGKIDYREVLDDADFKAFAKLRTLRKTLVEREGVPAYALFMNEQLAEMVRRRAHTQAALAAIEGVGDARVAKYGVQFIEALRGVQAPSEETDDGA